jgi:hypothetical protein
MKFLRKLPNSRREPPGLEWVLLKKLPMILLGGTLVPLFVSLGSRLYPPSGTPSEIAKQLKTVDIFAFATGLTLWTAVFTVALGCVVVMLMKGPAYVADAYDLSDAERPRRE